MINEVFTLQPGASLTCDASAAEVRLRVRDMAHGGRLRLLPVDPSGAVIRSGYLREIGPDHLLVHQLGGPLVLRVVPLGALDALPNHSSVQLQIDIENPGHAGQQVRSQLVDVSGLPYADVLELTPLIDGRWSIHNPLPQHADTAEGIRALARNGARTVTGLPRVEPGGERHTYVVLDRSASMSAALRDGTVARLVETVAGVDEVVGAGAGVRVWSASAEVRPETRGADDADGLVVDVRSAPTSGFQLTRVVESLAGMPGPAAVYVVTDDLPFDLERAAEAVARGPADLTWVLVLLARTRFDPARLGGPPRPSDDAARTVGAHELGRLHVVSVAADSGALDPDRATGEQVRGLVRALLVDDRPLRRPA